MMSRRLNKVRWFLRSLVVLTAVRAALTLIPYNRFKSWIPSSVQLPAAPREEQARCAWAIARAARFIPHATCLTQALAGQWLLARQGFGSRVVIGVRRAQGRSVAAHAWLRVGEDVVLGGDSEDLSTFTELTELGVAA